MDPHDSELPEDDDSGWIDDSPRWVQVGKLMLALTPIVMLVMVIGIALMVAVLAMLAYFFLDFAGSGFGP